MKKTSFEAIRSALIAANFSNADILAELDKEINKGAEAKAKNAEAYEAMHDIIVGALSDTPATCSEIFESIENDLPMGTTKGKVQYALTHLWQDEIVKVEGKPNGYKRA
jgi:hypothetical protein